MPRTCRSLALAPLLLCLLSARARADGEGWLQFEIRAPVVRAGGPFIKTDLRILAETRLNQRSAGLHQQFLRVGPLFHVTSWMFIGVHGTIYADRAATGLFEQEARFEIEPNLYKQVGDWYFQDRNRFEYRWRDHSNNTVSDRGRYRNQLRIHYAPVRSRWLAVVWDEVLVDFHGEGLNQNRLFVGPGLKIWDWASRIELGYMLRSRKDPDAIGGGWLQDHAVLLYCLFDFTRKPATKRAKVPPPPLSDPLFDL